MISIDKYAYGSKLKHTNPMQKLVFALVTLAVCIWANQNAVSAAVICVMCGVTVLRGGTSLRFFLNLMLVPMSFLVISVLTIAVNVSQKPDAFLAAIPIAGTWIGFSLQGLQHALQLFLKALGAVSCLYFLSLSTPMVDLLAALRRLRLPKLMVELMGLVYRFIFVLLETADTICNAQNCRLGYSRLSNAYRSVGTLASMLFIKSYKQADALYTALEARGYEGELNVLAETYESHWSGYALTAAVNTVLVLSAVILRLSLGGPQV